MKIEHVKNLTGQNKVVSDSNHFFRQTIPANGEAFVSIATKQDADSLEALITVGEVQRIRTIQIPT